MNQRQMQLIEKQMNEAIARDLAPYILISLIIGFFWLLTIVDILKSDFKDPNGKIIWVLIVTLTAPIGIILYYSLGINQKATTAETELYPPIREKNHPRREDALKKNEWF